MGLDQYAWALKERPEKDTDFELQFVSESDNRDDWWVNDNEFGQILAGREGISRPLAYWRKHPNLHGLMRSFYERKGGSEFTMGEFAGPVVLDLDDIEEIEAATKAQTLPDTTGFFFGTSQPEHDKFTLIFCERARVAIEAGETVVYDSSW